MKGMSILGRVSPFLATFAILVASCGGRAAAPSTAPSPTPAPPAYELWVVDQAETTPTGGGTLYIYKGADLRGPAPAPAYAVNLGEAALGVGDGIGKHGHSITFNPAMTHAVISYVDSGHVQVIRAADRKVVASIKVTGGAAGPAAPHASAVTPAAQSRISRSMRVEYFPETALTPVTNRSQADWPKPFPPVCRNPSVRAGQARAGRAEYKLATEDGNSAGADESCSRVRSS